MLLTGLPLSNLVRMNLFVGNLLMLNDLYLLTDLVWPGLISLVIKLWFFSKDFKKLPCLSG